LEEREDLAALRAQSMGVRAIARRLGRCPSTISRELKRNTVPGRAYRPSTAQRQADCNAQRRCAPPKLVSNVGLRDYVIQRLSGQVATPAGTRVGGPAARRRLGRRLGHGQDRGWGWCWSPEQIAARLPVDFPDDESMRISHETIYQSLFVQSRGGLRAELSQYLRTGRPARVPQARTRGQAGPGRPFVTEEVLISARPAEAEDRAVPGHWEGDLIIGEHASAIGSLVERSTRFTMLLHLPPMPGHRTTTPTKNGPALSGHGAEAVRNAIAAQITTLPEHLRRSLTWDQGSEMAQHAQLKIQAGIKIYFCPPRTPWLRGSNENTNGLLRQYFPKGTDHSRYSREELDAVAHTLNTRPRKTLGWRTPAEALDTYLHSIQQAGVATSP
jgi:IS30 family transposase